MRIFYKRSLVLTIIFSVIMMVINYYILNTQMKELVILELQNFEIAQYAVFTVFGGPIDPQQLNIGQMALYMIVPIFMLVNIFHFLTYDINKTSLLVLIRKKSAFKFILDVEKKIIVQVTGVILIYIVINTVPMLKYVSLLDLFPYLSVVLLIYLLQYFCMSNILYLISMLASKLYTIIIYVFTLIFELCFIYIMAESMTGSQIKTKFSFFSKYFFHTKAFINYYNMPFDNWHTITIFGNDFVFNVFYLIGSMLVFVVISVLLIKTKKASIFIGHTD